MELGYADLLRAVAEGESIAVEGVNAQAAASSTPPGKGALWKADGHYRYAVLEDNCVRHNLLAGEGKEISLDALRDVWEKFRRDDASTDYDPLGDILYADFGDPLWFKHCLTIDPRDKIERASRRCGD